REFTPELSAAPRVRPGGVYLITGGLGAIPLTVAEHLARAGAKLALVGRSYPDSRQQDRLNTLNGPGTPALYWRADVADEAQVRRVVVQVRERFGRIDGVFHCAGVHRDAYLVNKTARELDEVLAAKLFGTVNLDRALGDAPLDFFCLASSVSAVAGNIGQGDYAYANRFMDAFVDWRRAQNRPGLSLAINWPYWAEGGMRVDPEAEKIMTGQWRMSPLSNRAGLEILDAVLAGERGRVMVVEGDGEAIRAHFGVGAMRGITVEEKPYLNTLTPTPLRLRSGQVSHREREQEADDMRAGVEDTLRGFVSQLLKIDPADLDGEEELSAFGIDSINLTRLTNRINERYGLTVLPTLFFEYHTLRNVAEHLLQTYPEQITLPHRMGEGALTTLVHATKNPPRRNPSPEPPERVDSVPPGVMGSAALHPSYANVPSQTPIAIIGLAGVMPQSASLDEFWSHLAEGRSLITEIPPERWDWREHYGDPQDQPGKTLSRWGGFIHGADKFDAPFFNIAPREAELMDPQQRLYLECVWSAIEDAGYRPAALARSKTGVFTGVCTWDYHELLRENGVPVDAYLSTGAAHSVVSNRVSYLLDLRGPSETVDTACSSSLVAIHRAVQALQSGHCELAIAGGVQLMATPSAHISFDRAGMLSRQGRARPFDAEADGYVRGEGVGAVLLKPLDAALRDGDPIHAVIRGTATNHGGKANSFTAPNPQAQAEVIADAWQRAGLDPATATYIEAHGTGTKLGDPVEMNGLKKAFQQLYEHWGHPPAGDGRCAVGSVKANIGHLEAAAGIAGVIKVVLAFRHGMIPGIAHFREANPLLQLDNGPFRLAEQTTPWPRLRDSSGQALPRRAGISSFGFGGTNAHLVLEEFLPEPEMAREGTRPVLILLSAADEDRLRAYVLRLADWLDKALRDPTGPVSLRAVAHTLHAGRTAMEERLALVAANPWRLLETLRDWAESGAESADLYRGSLGDSKAKAAHPAEDLLALAQAEDWRSLARAWTQGADLAQTPLYPDAPRRAALPTYPFARHSYWVPRPSQPAAHTPESFMGIHPLLDGPAADAAPGTKYTKVLRQEEFFLADHRITDRLILPGVAHIEMARAACAAASGQRVATLRNIVWIRPIVLETPTLAVDVELTETDGELAFEIAHRAPDGARILFTQGKAVLAPQHSTAPDAERLDVADILARCPMHRSREDYYRLLRDVQFDLGPSFQVIRDMHASPDEVLTLLELPPHLRGDTGFALHPSLLDGAIQTVAGVTAQRLKARYLPFTLGRFEILKPLPDRLYAHARLTQTLRQGEAPLLKFTMCLADERGEVCVRFHDFIAAPFSAEKAPESRPAGEVLRLKPRWQTADRESMPAPRDGASHAWVLFAADEASARSLRERFAPAGAAHILVARPGAEFRQTGPNDFLIRPDDGADYARLLRETGGWPVRIVHAWSHPALRGGVDAQAALKLGPISVFLLCRELARNRAGESAELLYVYPWAKHVLAGALAGVGGLARTLRQEMPWLDIHSAGLACGGAEDFPGVLADAVPNLADEFGARDGLEIRYEGQRRSVKSLVEVDPADFPTFESSVFRPDGVYLITGGMGAIGLLLAEHITAVAGARVVLAGRSAPDAVVHRPTRFSKPSRSLDEATAGRIRYVQADVSDRGQTRRLVDDIRATEGRLDGIIHGAGFLRDGLIAHKDAADFAAVLAPKILGALHLDEAVGSGPLDFFLCCSSIAALLGNAGQGDYALANLAMDEFMQWRDEMRRFGLRFGRSLSINWPLWRDGAMGTDATARELMKTALGLEPLDTASALDALEHGLRGGLANFAVLRGERAKLLRAFGVTDTAAPAPAPVAEAAPDEPPAPDLARRVEAAIRDLAARIIKMPIEKLPANRELTKLGFDSITLTELANGLNKEIGLELTPAVFFEHTSLAALAAHLSRDYQAIVSRKYGETASGSGLQPT
ncbi:SDR family NAD(P)-dependent oxidoreductase, partial [Methylomagnum sp.]